MISQMQKNVTIVVVPREQFNLTEESLESIYQNTNFPFELVYVDCNSPYKVKRYLEVQAKEKGFHLIHSNHYLTPNQARNMALAHVKTEYVVFIDNDVLVKPGWLNALIQCADQTGAWIVGPLCFEGRRFDTIHMAGGSYEFKQHGDQQWMIMRRPYFRTPLSKVRTAFKRQPTQSMEFHCVLVRMEVFEKLGILDEQIMSVGQEDDLCLTVLQANKPIYFEPSAVVSYIPPLNLAWSEMPFFYRRWSQAWYETSIRRLREKWNLSENAPVIKNYGRFIKAHNYVPEPTPQKGFTSATSFLKCKVMRLLRKIINWQTRVSEA
jgi:GT2 family glycosyltransferase